MNDDILARLERLEKRVAKLESREVVSNNWADMERRSLKNIENAETAPVNSIKRANYPKNRGSVKPTFSRGRSLNTRPRNNSTRKSGVPR